MRPDNAVPDEQLLKRFLLGQLSEKEAEPIERYLEQHPEMTATMAGLVKDDTLIGSLRKAAAPSPTDPPELAGLMDKLSQLRSPGDDASRGLPNDKKSDGDALAGLAPPQGPGEIGRLGGYRVLKVLGAGGMGMVYQGEDIHLQRPVALKVMKPEVARNPTARERFLREARAAAKLQSDHVVNVYQVGEDRQVVFLAMEFLKGMSLDDWLKKGRQPTLAQAARIGRQIALGLADAPRLRSDPPRHQAGQRLAGQRTPGPRQAARLRPGPRQRRGGPPDAERRHRRHAGVHGPRAGAATRSIIAAICSVSAWCCID